MSSQSDGVLLSRYASSGDDADFRPLVERYAPLVFGACLARLGRRELAEDAAQAVFLLLATKTPNMRASTTLAPWLLKVSRNVSMRLARSERRRTGRELPLDENLATAEIREEIGMADAIARLRGVERDAVILRFVQNLSFAEVGVQLGLSEDAARMRVQRAVVRLRREIAPLAAVPPSLLGRLARPLVATAAITRLANQGSMMNPTNLLLLLPIGAVLTFGASSLAPHAVPLTPPAGPKSNVLVASPSPQPTTPSDGVEPGAPPNPRRLKFEEYLDKDQTWFQKKFGQGDGGAGIGGSRTSEPLPLQWQTYDRRVDLGGGRWQMATATYDIGDDPQRPFQKVLSVTFEGPVGGRATATRVDHGVDPKPSRSFEQEAAYVGVNLADYDAVPTDPSLVEARRLVNRKHPEIVLTANDLNDTWHISLQLDPRSRK